MRIIAGMMMMGAMTACVVDEGDDALQGGNGKADGNNVCDVPQYGDGACHIDLACDVPDIDCFVTFDTDAAAAAWLPDIGRGNELTESDARFVRARKLLDQAWAMYQKYVPVGTKLAEKRLALVVTDSTVANAFVMPDLDGMRGGFVVNVEGGLVAADQTDEMVLGTMLHELKHLTGLHWLPEIDEKIEKHYVSPVGNELIGARQMNNTKVETHMETWQGHALVAGDWSDARLGGVPLGGDMQSLMSLALQNAECASQATAVNAAYDKMIAALSPVDDSILPTGTGVAELRTAFDAFEACWTFDDRPSLQDVAVGYEWTFDYLTPEEKMKAALPAPTAIRQIVEGRRALMRATETKYTSELVQPWSTARYFTYEEQADDTSMQVLVRERLDATAANEFFLSALGERRGACEKAVADGNVPYGIALSDTHHGTCWRYAHGLQIIEATMMSTMARETSPIVEAREPRIPRPATRRRPID